MLGDFKYIALWWLTYFVVGLLTLPLTFRLFKNFWDHGYVFSKVIASVLISYSVLILGIFKVAPFSQQSLFIIMFLLFLANFLHLRSPKARGEFFRTLSDNGFTFVAYELIFFVILATWSYVRGFAPDIEGLEKFMDWGFVNSALRSQYMPPADMWFSGMPINYYYFGHLVIAVLTKLSSVASSITYNLAIASTCALTFVTGFSLASNLVFLVQKKPVWRKIITAGLISAILVTFGGNLHAVYKITNNIIKQQGSLIINPATLKQAADSYWYPDATRFIGFDPDTKDKTIHEFPIYSFVVADLHGHMNDIPNVMFILSIFLALSYGITLTSVNWLLVVITGFWLSINFMTNAWDIAVYGMTFGAFIFLYSLIKTGRLIKSTMFALIHGAIVLVFWYLFTLPFSINFIPMAEGIRFSDAHTPFYQLFVLYGGFWLICLPLLIAFIIRKFKNMLSPDIFTVSLMLVGVILIIIPEIGYIKDIYVFDHRRANTMFKLVYQAFILFSLISGYVLVRFSDLVQNRPLKVIYKLLFTIIFVSHVIYPYFAIKSYYGFTKYRGLYGLNFLKNLYPDNYNAVNWINENIPGQPVILEAVGDSYTTFNQISVATGLPTVQGWVVHEWLWRGGYDKPAARQTDVQKIYESPNKDEVRTLLQKYNVKYIFVGDKEYEKYPKINLKNFESLNAKIIFESGRTRLYQL